MCLDDTFPWNSVSGSRLRSRQRRGPPVYPPLKYGPLVLASLAGATLGRGRDLHRVARVRLSPFSLLCPFPLRFGRAARPCSVRRTHSWFRVGHTLNKHQTEAPSLQPLQTLACDLEPRLPDPSPPRAPPSAEGAAAAARTSASTLGPALRVPGAVRRALQIRPLVHRSPNPPRGAGTIATLPCRWVN